MKLSTIQILHLLPKKRWTKQVATQHGYASIAEMRRQYDAAMGDDWVFPVHGPAFLSKKPSNITVDVDIDIAKPSKWTGNIETKCLSHCAAWGAYNPHNFLRIVRFRAAKNVIWQDKKSYNLGHTQGGVRNNSYYRRVTIRDGIDRESLVTPHYIYRLGYIAKSGKTEYHDSTISDARRGLKNKLRKRRENAKARRDLIKNEGCLITIKMLTNKFGWCRDGIDDFLSRIPDLEKDLGVIRSSKLLNRLLSVDLSPARDDYRSELAELLRYARSCK